MRFALALAYRFLVDGKAQSLLVIAGVVVGVSVQVFVSALIDGLQSDLIAQTVGTRAHVVVEPAREVPVRALRVEPGAVVLSRLVRNSTRMRSIDGWQRVVAGIRRMPGVRAASAKVSGPGIVVRGDARASAVVEGVDAATFGRIVPVAEHLVAGRFVLGSGDVVLGGALAAELGVGVGDRVRLETGGRPGESFVVRGLFDLGNQSADAHWALVSLRSGQALFDVPLGATHVDVALRDVFEAETVADRLRGATGLRATSWMTDNAQLLAALRSQSSSTTMIEAFVMLAVAMGISSVLVVSVVQRRGQIGILRAVGTTRRRVVEVFLLQGAFIGGCGAFFGGLLGIAFGRGFQYAMAHSEGVVHTVVFTPRLFAQTFAIAVVTGLVAAVLPARHAARLDPVEAIRRA